MKFRWFAVGKEYYHGSIDIFWIYEYSSKEKAEEFISIQNANLPIIHPPYLNIPKNFIHWELSTDLNLLYYNEDNYTDRRDL